MMNASVDLYDWLTISARSPPTEAENQRGSHRDKSESNWCAVQRQPCRLRRFGFRRRHACRHRLLCSGAPETHPANQSPPLMEAKPKNAEQPTHDRSWLGNDRATD